MCASTPCSLALVSYSGGRAGLARVGVSPGKQGEATCKNTEALLLKLTVMMGSKPAKREVRSEDPGEVRVGSGGIELVTSEA